MSNPTPLSLAVLGAVMFSWFFFAGIFLLRKKPPKAKEAKRDKRATLGIALQMVGYFLVFFQPPGRRSSSSRGVRFPASQALSSLSSQ